MPLNDYQLGYQGFTIGEGTNFEIYSVEGLGQVDVTSEDQPRFDVDGTVPSRHRMGKRIVTVEFEIARSNSTDLESDLATVRSAFFRRTDPTDEVALTFKLPGGVEKQISCRPTKRRIPVDARFARLNPLIVVEFEASDPRIYAATETVVNLSSGVNAGVTNAGNIDTYPTVIATSPGNLTNVTRGQAVGISGAAANAHTINFYKQTVVDNTGTDKFNLVSATSVWWALGAGASTVNVVGTTPSIRFRSAWDGI